jgi:AcrR family transcriptional regulator
MTGQDTAAPVRPHRRRKGEGHVTREAILAAARELFLADGYAQTTVRRIVARAGVTPPALYRHFADKDRILLEVADDAFGKLQAAFEAVLAEAPREPLEGLRRMMEAYVRFGLDHPDEYRFVFMTRELIPAEEGARGHRGAACFRMLEAQVARVAELGLLRPGDPALQAELIWAAGHGLVSLLITHRHFPWCPRESLIAGMVAMPLEGLLKR